MKLLVAEDDPVALEGMQGLLAKWGHEVVAAHDGAEAERLLLEPEAPAVAILDWMMPQRTGLDVCRTFRARNSGSPYIILITASHERKDIHTAFDAGVDDFIPKPVDPSELRARLKAADRIVTLQAHLQERAQVAEDRYRLLYASMNEGMALHEVICDGAGRAVDYRILDVNPAYEAITGIARQTAVGRRASEIYGTETPPYLATYARVAESGKPESFETYFTPLNRHFLISAFRPEVGRFATVFTDITERKRAEEAIRQSEAKWRTLFEEGTDGFLLVDRASARFLDSNRLMSRMLGYSRDEIRRLGVADIHRLEDLPGVMEKFNAQARGEISVASDIPVRQKNGCVFYADIGTTLVNVDGRLCMLGMFRDTTDRKRAQEKISSQLEELQRWQDVMLSREDRSQELKREVNELRRRLGEPASYPSQEENEEGLNRAAGGGRE